MIKLIESLLPSTMVEAFGWMIIHSLWQGAVLSVFLGLMMLITQKFSAKSRYFIAVVLLLFMPVVSIYTFFRNYTPEKNIVPIEADQAPSPAQIQVRAEAEENSLTYTVPAVSNTSGFTFKTISTYFSQHITIIVTAWLLGVLFFTLKFLGGLGYTQRMKHYRTYPVSEEWHDIFTRLCNNLKVSRPVKILQSAIVKVPMVIGFFKPVILIPVTAFTGLPARQLEIIIMHELAHIIRRDYIINIIQSLIEIIFFFHPAVWWMSKTIRAERENCCDDIAIEKSGDSIGFAKALANFQEQFLLKEKLAMTINGNNNNLFKRIKRLLNQPNMKTSFTEGFTASCIIFAGIFILLINTGSSGFANTDEMPAEKYKAKHEIKLPVDDSTNLKTTVHNKQVSPEDKLLDLEKSNSGAQKTQKIKPSDEYDENPGKEPVRDDERIFEEEIINGVEAGLENMDIDMVVDEAMRGTEAGIAEIDLNLIVNEALKGIDAGLEAVDAGVISTEILYGIQSAIEETDLNLIAGEILSGLRLALEEININKIVENQVNSQVATEDFRGNSDHLNMVLKGTDRWNKWRSDNPLVIPDLRGVELKEAKLVSIDFHNAILDHGNLGETVLDWANLENASLRYAIMKEASLNGTRFSGADLTGADLKEVNLSGQNLRGVFFNNANLKEADLSVADLRDCDLSNANMREADLSKADLRGANLKGTDLSEAELSGAKMAGAIADEFTLFPEGFNPDTAKIIVKH